MLEKYPKVNVIGHAQTWWSNVDKAHDDQRVLYPKTAVSPGGITDQLLRDYPNMYGDLSAGSGLNSLTRDEAHARGFLERHKDQLLYGSDCNDVVGKGEKCSWEKGSSEIRKLYSRRRLERKTFTRNAHTI